MADFVQANQVFLDQAFTAKEDVLQFLSARACELGIGTDEAAVRAAFDQREEEGSTGLIDGFAVPHAKTDAIGRAAVIVVRMTDGIGTWESLDGSAIDVAIALLVPAGEAGTTHIGLLAQLSRALMDESFRAAVRTASDAASVASLINGRLDA